MNTVNTSSHAPGKFVEKIDLGSSQSYRPALCTRTRTPLNNGTIYPVSLLQKKMLVSLITAVPTSYWSLISPLKLSITTTMLSHHNLLMVQVVSDLTIFHFYAGVAELADALG